MNESNACTPSEPPYCRVVLKRMEQGNDELRAAVIAITTKMDAAFGLEPSAGKDAITPTPPVGCVMDEFDVCLSAQIQLLNRLNAEINRLSRFI